MAKSYRFPCGCEFPILSEYGGIQIDLDLDIEKIPRTCSRTWDLISSGRTTGIFQIESQLGKKLAKDLKPKSIEHLSALVAIMRPGCMEGKIGKKSLTQHYIDRKNGLDAVEYFHPALEPILKDTYGILIYQEQSMAIARELAGFTLSEADTLRKGIGKKVPEIIAKMKVMFLEKAEKLGKISLQDAKDIFDWIEKSQRYQFNASHSFAYALNAYLTAYAKAHFPKAFFCSYLRWAQAKLDTEAARQELINDARMSNIDVRAPSLANKNKYFKIFGNEIYVGLTDIKGIGESGFNKLIQCIEEKEEQLNKPIKEFTWLEYLIFISPSVSSVVNNALMASGSLDFLGKPRTTMIYEYELFVQLKEAMLKWLETNYDNSKSLCEHLKIAYELPTGKGQPIAVSSTKEKVRGIIYSLENPSHSLEDSISWIAKTEDNLFGCSLTYSEIDDKDTTNANCTCREFENGFPHYAIIAAKIEEVKETTIKNGKNKGGKMAFVKISDGTGMIDAVVFTEVYKKYKAELIGGGSVMIGGQKGKKKDSGLIIDKVWPL